MSTTTTRDATHEATQTAKLEQSREETGAKSGEDFVAPMPRRPSGHSESALRGSKEQVATISTEKGKRTKELPKYVEDEGLRAKSERKRLRSEKDLGTKLEGALEGDGTSAFDHPPHREVRGGRGAGCGNLF